MRNGVCRIIAWHPVLTDHQAYTYQELQSQSGVSVIVNVAKLQDETRRTQGWSDTRVSDVERQLLPTRGFLRKGLRYLLDHRDQIHIFGSAFESPRMMLLLWFATRLGVECYIISEPYSPVALGYFGDQAIWRETLKAKLRPYLYRLYMLALRKRLKGVFTISRLAAKQYKEAGMPVDRLFPFGYFVPSEITSHSGSDMDFEPEKKGDHLRLVFVGSLITIKGLSTLIRAVRSAIESGCDVQLDVYGPGDPSNFDFDDDRIRYAGRIPFGYTQQHLLGYDLLVLPSHYDGWGVVVNEALCANVPVLCSDRVGARVLVESFGAGLIFPCGNDRALTDQLIALKEDPEKLKSMKSACSAVSEAIQPKHAAAYMLKLLSVEPGLRDKIPSPWYRTF